MCEQKRRHNNKTDKDVILAYAVYNQWYKLCMFTKKEKTYDEFAKSNHYIGFVKFGRYINDTKIKDWQSYLKWLIDTKVKFDIWAKDSTYSSYSAYITSVETPDRAVEKFILTAEDWGNKTGNHWSEFWHKVNPYIVIDYINQGKISPWILFSLQSAQDYILGLPDELIPEITKNIDIDYWKKKTTKQRDDREWINQVLQ